jgi:UDP-N-acetylglucosamine 3-dehydrogenase
MGKSMTKVAVLGLGSMGRQHVRVLSELPQAELVLAADISSDARARVEQNLSVPTASDWRAVLDTDAQVVVNALPTPDHYTVTRELLHAGRDVLVEKPIAVSSSEAEDLVEAAASSDQVFMVGHVERFNPAVQAARRLISEGAVGDPVSLAARRVGVARPIAPRTDVVTDLAIHDIDICGMLLPATQGRLVFASGRSLGENQVEDHADLVLRFGTAVAIVQANWITPVKVRRLTITGTAGLIEVDYLEQSVRLYRGTPEVFEGPLWNFFAVARESDAEEISIERREPLRAELEHLIDRVRARDTSIAEARQAAQALALAVAATDVIRGRG